MALVRYEAGICECGFHESLTSDKSNFFGFEPRVCNVCAGADRFSRNQAAEDKAHRDRLGEDAPPTTPDPADGRRVFTRMLTPVEVEQHRARHQPTTPKGA